MNISEQVSQLWCKLKTYFRNLNLFPSVPPSTDEHQIRNQRISTIVFIILLILLLIILILYISLDTVIKVINVPAPTLTQYSQLYSKYSQTLTCTCTKIAINYDKLLHINYTLHQVCTSVFVTQNWFNYMISFIRYNTLYLRDFRGTAPLAFQTLLTLCNLINKTISDSLTRFYSSQYVSASVTPFKLFQSQIKSLVDQFRMTTTNTFLLSLSIIGGTTHGNTLHSGLQANYEITISNVSHSVVITPQSYSNCSCSSSATCIENSSIYTYPNLSILFTLPGFYVGCYMMESLLFSTLQCFYNQTCIDKVLSYYTSFSTMNVAALNSSISSQYSVYSTVAELLDQLMIEEWNFTDTYDKYYDQCEPKECSYTIETRNNVIYFVVTVIGLVAGLIKILKLFVPRVVKFVRRKKERRPVVVTVIKVINVPAPTLTQYSQLYSKYSQTLTCTCTKIAINYDKLLHVNYTLHQVCTSVFVTQNWFNYIEVKPEYTIYDDDFRRTSSYTFQALSAFCDLINKTISDSLNRFYSSQYVSASVTPFGLFQLQTKSIVDQFRMTTTNTFLLSLSIIRNTTQANGLLSGLMSNFLLFVINGSSDVGIFWSPYSNCNCGSSATCVEKSAIRTYPDDDILFTVPGFYVGCYVIESLLVSTLQCFYNQTCIDKVLSYYTSFLTINVAALNSSISSQYSVYSTVAELLDQLMIEEWNFTDTYDKYYDQCEPKECSYTIETRNYLIYIVTTVIGLVGSLVTILKLTVPPFVKLIMYCIRKRSRRVVQEISKGHS